MVSISERSDIQAVKLVTEEGPVYLFADYLLICLSDPAVSVPNRLNLLVNYQVNSDKGEFIPPRNNIDPIFLAFLPFK